MSRAVVGRTLAAAAATWGVGLASAAELPTSRPGAPAAVLVRRFGSQALFLGGTPEAVAFSPDGKSLAGGWNHGAVGVWGWQAGRCVLRTDYKAAASAVAFTPDGRGVLAAYRDALVCLYELPGGKAAWRVLLPQRYAASLAVSKDGRTLMVEVDAVGAEIRDMAAGRLLGQIDGVVAPVMAPDGKRVYGIQADGTVGCWDVPRGRLLRTLGRGGPRVRCVAVSPDGRCLAAAGVDGTVAVWDLPEGSIRRRLNGEGEIGELLFVGDSGDLLAIDRGEDLAGLGVVSCWSTATGRQRYRLPRRPMARAAAVAPDGEVLAMGNLRGGIDLWDLARQALLPVLGGHASAVRAMALSPDDKSMLTGDAHGRGILWDVGTGKAAWQFQAGQEPFMYAAFSPDGGRVVLSIWREPLRVWDLAERQPGKALTGDGQWCGAARFTSDGKQVVGIERNRPVTLWDLPAGRQREIPLRLHQENAILSPDWRYLAKAEGLRTIRVVPTLDSSGPRRVLETAMPPGRMGFSVDGRLLAVADLSGDVRVVELASGEEVSFLSLRGPKPDVPGLETSREPAGGPATWLVFSPDGDLLAVSSGRLVRLWDVAGARLVDTLAGHTASVTRLLFSGDGRCVFTASDDRTVVQWDLAPLRAAAARPAIRAATFEGLWGALADGAPEACRAVAELTGGKSPDGADAATVLLEQKLKLAGRPASHDARRIPQLIADLDSRSYQGRQRAHAALRRLGSLAGPALAEALKTAATEELRSRLRSLLEAIRTNPPADGETLRLLRAVWALERIGTARARAALAGLAADKDMPVLAAEAAAALARLGGMATMVPATEPGS